MSPALAPSACTPAEVTNGAQSARPVHSQSGGDDAETSPGVLPDGAQRRAGIGEPRALPKRFRL